MWVFIWKASGYANASSKVFMNFPDAWDHFKNLTVVQFPDVMLEVTQDPVTHFGTEWSLDAVLTKGFELNQAA